MKKIFLKFSLLITVAILFSACGKTISENENEEAYVDKIKTKEEIKTVIGRSFDIKSIKGNIGFLYFCNLQDENYDERINMIDSLDTYFVNENVVIYVINTGDEEEKVVDKMHEEGYMLDFIVDEDSQIATSFEIEQTPTLILTDIEGNIISKETEIRDFQGYRKQIEKILEEEIYQE